ncbi:hypothetical protein CLHOM_08220 [Clostridium homopropionicum DSM 5847]|uniref:Uncharacterized protein n=1 Tax=Clostridium homopropionicum DSM 5847 TaxID=1121318 RepID=A0A0L6ZCJ3_9CLOT|nr:hypothetical protein [Clostridium homopropionicum]KOA20680.1 hypothetical protein CLHOM_08220 [Clostridium homopropionicum DSM 5847]SFF91640.1 hypothetical protein SAMN04488501_103180 [Clostridium homopropionicum]
MRVFLFLSKARRYDEGFKNAFANSLMFYNCSNIGVPLITLVFSSNPFIIYIARILFPIS